LLDFLKKKTTALLGNIFRKTENNESKTELLIFITPSIINELL